MIAYGFISLEMVAITAYEARDLRSLRRPSQTIAYFVSALYLFCVIGELLNVRWTNEALPDILDGMYPQPLLSVMFSAPESNLQFLR